MGRKKSDGPPQVISFEEAKAELAKSIEDANTLEASLFSDEAILNRMNADHAFIHSYGGKPVITSYVYSEVIDKHIMEFSSPDSMIIRYANKSVQVGNSVVPLGKWWLANADRREYNTVIFDPAKPKEYKNCLNLWEGFACEPKKGRWNYTLRHVYKILCNGEASKFKYFIKWLAWCVQNPARQAEVCVVFKGKEGAGKGFIFTQFVEIFGLHGFTLANRELLTGKHNGHLSRCVFLFADEAYYPGDKEAEGVLKQLITQPTIAIRSMYKDAIMGMNRLHIAMSTNNEWVIPAGEDARRYFINEVDNSYAKGKTSDLMRNLYFSILWEEMANGGREAMLFDLLQMDLRGWHPRDDIPATSELEKQKYLNLNQLEHAVHLMLEEGVFPGEFDRGQYTITSQEFADFVEKLEPNCKKYSANKKGDIAKKLGAEKIRKTNRICWEFPTLKQMRINWNGIYTQSKWDLEEEWYIQRKAY